MKQRELLPLVYKTRGEKTEYLYDVHVVVIDNKKNIIGSIGNPNFMIYPRSAIKPVQALGFIESGAIEKYELTSEEIAISAASHNAEKKHIDIARSFLNKINLSESELECGPQNPRIFADMKDLITQNLSVQPIHNNCSGKHIGFLADALMSQIDRKNYLSYDHPIQQKSRKILTELSEFDFTQSDWGIDGCGIPTVQLPLYNLAVLMFNFTHPSQLSTQRAQACQLLESAIVKHPFLIGGTKSLCSRLIEITKGRIFAKIGADSVYACAIKKENIAIALKVISGDMHATVVALTGILQHYNLLTKDEEKQLKDFISIPILNSLQNRVGYTKFNHSILK